MDTAHDKDVPTDVLQTTLWDRIPDDAQGLIKTDNGIYACFRGNELLVSELFIPYAFPESYRLTVEDRIVALGHVDSTIVILTTGRPYLAQGAARSVSDGMELHRSRGGPRNGGAADNRRSGAVHRGSGR